MNSDEGRILKNYNDGPTCGRQFHWLKQMDVSVFVYQGFNRS